MLTVSALLAFLCVSAQDASEGERLIQSLASASVEIRDKALNRLVEMGTAVLPILRKAAASKDSEMAARAKLAIEDIERLDLEKTHDAAQRAALLKESAEIRERHQQSKAGQEAWAEGASFTFYLRTFKGGTVLSTRFNNYLSKSYEDGLSDLTFDVIGIQDKDGKDLAVERCGRCSPYSVYAKDSTGPIKPHLKGTQLWFSTYILEFQDPKEGDRKKVGDFTLEVAWPTFKVSSKRPYPRELLARIGGGFSYEVKPGVIAAPRISGRMGARAGGGGGGRGGQGDEWCHCKGGPQPVSEKPQPEFLSEWVIRKDPGYMNPLADVAAIKLWILKPVEELIDLSPELAQK